MKLTYDPRYNVAYLQLHAKDVVEAVTADDILRVSQQVYTPGWLNLSVIGPFSDADHFRNLLRFS